MANPQSNGSALGLIGLGAIALFILNSKSTPAPFMATARGFSVAAGDSEPGCTPCEAARAQAFQNTGLQ